MRMKVLALVTLGMLAACQSGGQNTGNLQLTELVVNTNLTAGVPYSVSFRYEGDAVGVKQVCFLWSGEGPFCWSDFTVDQGAKMIHTQARTRNPKSYNLAGFVRYSGGTTNRVSKGIKVSR